MATSPYSKLLQSTSAFLTVLLLSGSHVLASSPIQMLPPVVEGSTNNSTPTQCPNNSGAHILTWDGANPIYCASGISTYGGMLSVGSSAGGGNLVVFGDNASKTGTIFANGSITTQTTVYAQKNVMVGDTTMSKATFKNSGTIQSSGDIQTLGVVQLGGAGAPCDATTNIGAIRYNDGVFEGCNGTGWLPIAGSPLPPPPPPPPALSLNCYDPIWYGHATNGQMIRDSCGATVQCVAGVFVPLTLCPPPPPFVGEGGDGGGSQ